MSFLLLRMYEHIQNRAIRLGALCAFVITFIGLPAMGQYMGTNAFASLDLVSHLENSIDKAAVSMEEARYQSYLAQTDQLNMEDDQMVMLAEEIDVEEAGKELWDVEQMFKNVFSPTGK